MKKFTFFLVSALLLTFTLAAQSLQGFISVTQLDPVAISANTGEKPQSKPWTYDGKWWVVLPNSSGTHLWRLDGKSWTHVLRLSSRTTSKADCKVAGNITHIFLFQGPSSELVSVEYGSGTYSLWSKRTSTTGINLDKSAETATIDIDGNGRMWLASDSPPNINVRWSDPPYTNWSSPITIATGVKSDDICAVVALPGKIGVLWSNQNSQRFGFKTHTNGSSPSSWSSDEVPASQSALNLGDGMADDHLNMAVSSDGTLYCAVKTSYNTRGYPLIALLVRRPNGQWDELYHVSDRGTRPIVILNEAMGKVKVIYTSSESGGDILYSESLTSNIAFGPTHTLIKGTYNNVSSIKDKYSSEVVIIASTNTQAVGVLATDGVVEVVPQPPLLASPANSATEVGVSPTLFWNASGGANSYQAQVSTSSAFSTTIFNQSGITGTSASLSGLANNTTYYWRVRAANAAGNSAWSSVWSFTTVPVSSGNPLVAHWQMDEGSGATLVDASEYRNAAAISGSPAWVTGVIGQALRFNGSNQYATAPDHNSLDLSNSLTIAAWIRPERVATQYLIKKAAQNETDGYELSLASTGNVFFRFNQSSSGNTYRVNSIASYPSNGSTWMHVAVTYNGSSIKIYIDGVENASKSFPSPPPIGINELNLTIGAEDNGFRGLLGAMDDVRIYNTALSASQISQLAAVDSGPVLASVPVLSSPSNQSTGASLTQAISWAASNGANSYQAQVSTSSAFSTTIFNQSSITGTSASLSGLANNTTYYWRVRAANAAGNSAWSSVWSFTTVPGSSGNPLVAHWQMNEGSGTTLVDASGYGNNGSTVKSPTWVTGVSGLALSLNGRSQYATVNHSASLNITQAITLAAWIRPNTTGTQYIIKKAVIGTVDGYELSLANNGLVFFRVNQASSSDTYRLNSVTPYPTNGTTWMHIAATFDGSVMRIYINGELNNSRVFNPQTSVNTNTLVLGIGAQSDGKSRFSGSIDEARVYNTALSASEVSALAAGSFTVANISAGSFTEGIQAPGLPQEFLAYPNPTSSNTTINFVLEEDDEYVLSIFNLRGELINTLKQGTTRAGELNRVEIDGLGYPVGLYFVRLQTNREVQTLKLVFRR
jgi:hypothetical protein